MREPLTLYRSSKTQPESLFRLPPPSGGGPDANGTAPYMLAYLRRPPGPKTLAQVTARVGAWVGDSADPATTERLLNDLEGLGGPLLLVVVRPGGEPGSLQVALYPSGGFDGPPNSGLRLTGGGDEGPIDLPAGVVIDVGAPEHLILPLDQTAQQSLATLSELLLGFGPDLKRLLLATLASPTLDVRLDRIEQALRTGGVSMPLAESQVPTRGPRRMAATLIVMGALAGGFLGAVSGTFTADRVAPLWRTEIEPETLVPPAADRTDPGGNGAQPRAEPAPQAPDQSSAAATAETQVITGHGPGAFDR